MYADAFFSLGILAYIHCAVLKMSQPTLPFQLPQSYNFRVLLEPKGFIRVIEFVLAIFAFATCCGYTGTGGFSVTCAGGAKPQYFKISYPFRLTEQVILPEDICNTANGNKTGAVIGSEGSSQFFVFVGVWSFLTCLATIILYVVFDQLSQVMHWIPQADFVHSIAIAVMWLISSAAWAQGLVDIKQQTSVALLMGMQTGCKQKNPCHVLQEVDYASLNVSVIFGFLCMAVWAGNLWFLFKETKWFKVQEQTGASAGVPTGLPPAPSAPASSGFGAPGGGLPSYPTNSPFAPPGDPAFMQNPPSRI